MHLPQFHPLFLWLGPYGNSCCMISTGTLLRIIGAAILLIAVQFASVAAKAHAGHGHGPLMGTIFKGTICKGMALRRAPRMRFPPTRPRLRNRAVQTQPAAQAEATVQNAPGALPSGSDACVIGCCGMHGLLRSRAGRGFAQPSSQSVLASHRLCTRYFRSPEWTLKVCANPLDPSPE